MARRQQDPIIPMHRDRSLGRIEAAMEEAEAEEAIGVTTVGGADLLTQTTGMTLGPEAVPADRGLSVTILATAETLTEGMTLGTTDAMMIVASCAMTETTVSEEMFRKVELNPGIQVVGLTASSLVTVLDPQRLIHCPGQCIQIEWA